MPPEAKEFFCDVAGCGRKLDPGEPFICKRHPGWRTCHYCNTPFDASGPDYPKGIVLTDWCCPHCGEKLRLKRQIEKLEAETEELRKQAKCGHSPWPCKCSYRSGGFCG